MFIAPVNKCCQVPLTDISLPQEDISVSMKIQHVNRRQAQSKVFIPAGSRHRYVTVNQSCCSLRCADIPI